MEWTFANLEGNWENEVFSTKQEAIEAGKAQYEDNFQISQLMETEDYLIFAVRNIETIEQGVFI